jgi:fatty-acyl-CoA synthase
MATGDLGYLVEEQLVVCGRSKDIIIMGGRNIYPDDIERIASSVDGVWRGHVAAFGIEDMNRERLIVAVESEVADEATLSSKVAEAVLGWAEVSVSVVRVVGPRGLPRTSSGKLSRAHCREAFLEGSL